MALHSYRLATPGLLGFLAAGIVLLQTGCGSSPSSGESKFSFPAELKNYPTNTGDPTLNLWNKVNSELILLKANCPPNTEEGMARRTMIGHVYSDSILNTSHLDADPELVEWALRVVASNLQFQYLSEYLDRVAKSGQSRTSPSDSQDKSNWLGTGFSHQWLASETALRQQGVQLQQSLSQRYGKAFPACQF